MQIYRLGNISNNRELLQNLGVQGGGVSIISKKMDLHIFQLKNIKTPALNILKQDALSIGAELAVPSGVITCAKDRYDAILIVNSKQLEILAQKELAQPFGLKELAKELSQYKKDISYPIKIMGIINANEDSFYSGSRFKSQNAIDKCLEMIDDGANIIDIGGVSTKPNADIVSLDEELERIKPICDMIKSQKLYEKTIFSIDSFNPKVIEYALNSGFKIINDIMGAKDKRVIELAIKYSAKLSIMHIQGTPQTMQDNPYYNDVVADVTQYFKEKIEICQKMGLSKDNIIIDVGIGFGKRLEDNIALIKNLEEFKKFGCEILIGASRKSMIDKITPTKVEDRLSGTLAIHLKALDNGANIIRCHDVKEHKQALVVYKEIC
ncbi:Alternative dihydrofolate reductase 2 / Dihydropteroate synthase [hydrothermal vent metagenome]|uniref:dihydropteroate synthase n=1 Tax=hydrothermal vent metagenome TaxID=652676 RepID=A0A1W1EKT3_9ZZZZ